MEVNANSCKLVIEDVIQTALYLKDGTYRTYFPHEKIRRLVENLNFFQDINLEEIFAILTTISTQMKGKDGIQALVFMLKTALDKIDTLEQKINNLISENKELKKRVEVLLKTIGKSEGSMLVEDVFYLQSDLSEKLRTLGEKYGDTGKLKSVSLDDIESVEWLERRICKLVCKNVFASGSVVPTESKYIGVLLHQEQQANLYFFETKEEASKWSCDIQKQKYSESTPWVDNPFSNGVYFEIDAFKSSEEGNLKNDEGSFLCLSDAATIIDTGIDIRPHVDIFFEVKLANGEFAAIGGHNHFFENNLLKTVIIDTGAVREFNMLYATVRELRLEAIASGLGKLQSGGNIIVIENEDRASIVLRLHYPRETKEVDVVMNKQGTAVGIPGFEFFNQVFVLDATRNAFEFVPAVADVDNVAAAFALLVVNDN